MFRLQLPIFEWIINLKKVNLFQDMTEAVILAPQQEQERQEIPLEVHQEAELILRL